MKAFLKEAAEYIFEKYGHAISDFGIVFPNKRAALFFTSYLSEITNGPIWAPSFYTINELFKKTSNLSITDDLNLVFKLYEIFSNLTTSPESFDDFYYWGEMLLNDFDDIDKYIVNAQDVFQNISSLKEIECRFDYLTEEQKETIKQFWYNFNPEKHSEHKDKFIGIWQILFPVYQSLRKSLLAKNEAYEGMIYRETAEKIKKNEDISFQHKLYVFIGFNALNQSEKVLFDYLMKEQRALFLWDYDEYYLDKAHKKHEAGFFIRDNIRSFPPPQDFNFNKNELSKGEKNIEIVGAPSEVAQAKIIPKIFDSLKTEDGADLSNTALVPADENLLLPVLYSLPYDVDGINITMGYPIANSGISSLLEHLLELQKTCQQSQDIPAYYHRLVLKILHHPYILLLDEQGCKRLINKITKENIIYISEDEFQDYSKLSFVFQHFSAHKDFSQYLLNLLHLIFVNLNKSVNEEIKNELEKEFIYQFFLTVQRLNEITTQIKIDFSIETYLKLLKNLMQSISVSFIGEPLEGLQLMGILETRGLDFENIILLSVNEGVLPKTGAASSFIPYNLRKGFGLPTLEHQDAIYAYYFYRLIQRAKNIFLCYNTSSEGLGGNEMSRYIAQLKFEAPFNIHENNLVFEVKNKPESTFQIEKSDEIMELLRNYFSHSPVSKHLSPSAINSYIDCSMRFYFQYIQQLKEADELHEDIDAAIFGTIVHNVMQELYSNFTPDEKITAEKLTELDKNEDIKEKLFYQFYKEEFLNGRDAAIAGQNSVAKEVAMKYISGILQQDIKLTPFSVISLEQTYMMELPVVIEEKTQSINLYGKIDRIDDCHSAHRVIDYKTGKTNNSFKGVSSLFEKGEPKRNKEVFQSFLYALLYDKHKNDTEHIVPGLYFIREVLTEKFNHLIKDEKKTVLDFNEYKDEFVKQLSDLLSELFNRDVPFTQVENQDMCKYCKFKAICNR